VKKAKLSVLLGSIFIILVFSLGPAYSTPLSSASYSIPSLTISSGGHTGLQSSSYKLQDIKGQAVIGYGSSASYGIGIGGVYGTLVPGEGGISAWSVDPHVQNLSIRRNGLNIEVYWNTDDATLKFWVFRKRGVFGDAVAGWDPGADNGSRTVYVDTNQVGTGLDQIYYRVLSTPSGTTSVDINQIVGKVAVGKKNLTVNTGWNQVAVPFTPMAVNESVGTNFAVGDQLWAYRSGRYAAPISYSGTAWEAGIEIATGEGYGLKIMSVAAPAGAVKTLIGAVKAGSFTRAVAADWNLIGNPYAKNLTGDSGLTNGANGDQIWEWAGSAFLSPKTFSGTSWSAAPALEIGKGYGYKHLSTGFNWQLTAPIY
jgi:hypothetical protein